MFKKLGKSGLALFCVVTLLVSMFGTAMFTTAEAATLTQGFEAPSIYVSGGAITKNETIFISDVENGYEQYVSTGSGDTNVRSGSKSLYRSTFTGTKNTSLITEGMELVVGKRYSFEGWVKVLSGSNGTLKFIQISARSNGWSSGWNDAENTTVMLKANSTYDAYDQWKKITFDFVAGQKYFALSSESVGFYMDDIVITPVAAAEVTVTIEANNGKAVDPVKGAPGSALALPTVTKDGFEFVAWHTKPELNAPFTANVFPNDNITLYAQWKQEGLIIQDFEAPSIYVSGGAITKNETIFISDVENGYEQYVSTGSGDTNVRSGSKSLYRSTFTGTKNTSLITEGMELVVGKRYSFEGWVKVLSGSNGTLKFIQISARSNGWSSGWNDAENTTVMLKANSTYDAYDQWKKITFDFVAGQKYFALSSESVGFYMDDVTISPVVASEVTVTVNPNNGEATLPLVGINGTAMTMPAPTKTGYYLAGWYQDANLTKGFDTTKFPDVNCNAYAKWVKVGDASQDFEASRIYVSGGAITKAETIFVSTENGYQQYISTGSGDTNVHSGNKSLYRANFTGTKNTSLVTEGMELTVGKDYRVELWIKAIGGNGKLKFIQFDGRSNGWSNGWNDAATTVDVVKVNSEYEFLNQWKKLEFTFTAARKYFGISSESVGFYMDDVTVTQYEKKQVTVKVNPNNGETTPDLVGMSGDTLNIPVFTKEGYYLVGWYTDANLSMPFSAAKYPDENTEIWAKWAKNGTIIQDFENYQSTASLSSSELYNGSVSTGGQVLGGKYSLKGKSGNVRAVLSPNSDAKLTPGKSYKITANIFVPSTTDGGQIDFSLLNDFTNPWSYINENNKGGNITPYLNPSVDNSKATMDKWTTYEAFFYLPEDSEFVYLGLASWGVKGYYVDDVTVEEVNTVTVSFNTNGGSEIAPMIGAAGQKMTVDNPTPPEGKTFAGWCSDPELQNIYKISTFPGENITLYAKYITAGSFEQDFEQWNWEPNSNAQTEPFSLYTATSKDDPNVYSGTHSMYFDGGVPERVGGTFAVTLFDNTMNPLVIGEKYKATFRFKLNETAADKGAINQRTYQCLYYTKQASNAWAWQSQGCMGGYAAPAFYNDTLADNYWYGTAGAVTTTTKKDANGWLTMTYEFTATTQYLALYMSNPFQYSMWIDAITIIPLPTGFVSESDTTYCEEFYNVLNKNSAITALNTKEKKIQKLELDARGDYIFSASLKKGSLGSPRVYLAWDSEGKNIIEGTEFIGSTTEFKRFSSRIVTDMTGVVYLVTEGGGSDSYEKVQLFLRKFAYEKDPNPYYVRPTVDYDKLPSKTAAAETVSGDYSPQTGDNSFAAIAVLLATFAMAVIILMRKRGGLNA